MTMTAEAVRSGEGEARWWFGMLAEIKATAANTGGNLTIIEVTCPPGYEAPLHVHHREDEAFWVLEGSVVIHVGETNVAAGPGDYAFGPRDIPHRFSVGDAGCQMLFILTPGGLEGLVREMSEPAATRTLPPPSSEPPDLARAQAIAARYSAELLG